MGKPYMTDFRSGTPRMCKEWGKWERRRQIIPGEDSGTCIGAEKILVGEH